MIKKLDHIPHLSKQDFADALRQDLVRQSIPFDFDGRTLSTAYNTHVHGSPMNEDAFARSLRAVCVSHGGVFDLDNRALKRIYANYVLMHQTNTFEGVYIDRHTGGIPVIQLAGCH